MTSVITGDIINSRTIEDQNKWMDPLKALFNEEGARPGAWQIYRGDSFQLEMKHPEKALLKAIRIKAAVKCIKGLDVRMGIGIGEKQFPAENITEASGDAFVNSGDVLEALNDKKETLRIKTPWPEFDKVMNLCLRLALIVMDNWTPATAEITGIILEYYDMELDQKTIGKQLGIAQSSVSERLKRSYYKEIMEVEAFFRENIKQQLQA